MLNTRTKAMRAAKRLLRALDRGDDFATAWENISRVLKLSRTSAERALDLVAEVDPVAAQYTARALGRADYDVLLDRCEPYRYR